MSLALLNTLGLYGAYALIAVVTSKVHGQQAVELTRSDGSAGDRFGSSVAISGDRALVGAAFDDDRGTDSGSAYVFERIGGIWSLTAKLTAPDGTANDYFGLAVSVHGDAAVVGAWGTDNLGAYAGTAYVYRYDGAGWVLEAVLRATDGMPGDAFGASVSMSSDAIAIGAPGDDVSGTNSGSVYVFRYDGAAWVEELKLAPHDGAPFDEFGCSVSAGSGIVAVGARFDDDGATNAGSAYMFRFDGMTWAEEGKLTASDGALSDYFGHSVAVSGDTTVVGAPNSDAHGEDAGVAYVFRYDGNAWTPAARLVASEAATRDMFGISVAVEGNTVVVGAENDDLSGSVHVFKHESASWTLEQKLKPSNGAAWDAFGVSVSVDGGAVVAGAARGDNPGIDSGSAHVFWTRTVTADCDENHAVDTRDVTCYLNRWLQQQLTADCDGNARIDSRDMICFFNLWAPAR